jgi:hypothetical protein
LINKIDLIIEKNLLDWLEKSMTQIDLFSRRHRGMLENEKVEDYFTSGNSKTETSNDEES